MSAFTQLDTLVATIAARVGEDAATSYVAKMLAKGPAKIAQKVGEEAVETAIAAAANQRDQIVYESADLLFHLLMLWQAAGIQPTEIMEELKRREGTSGIAEKAARPS